MNPTRSTPTRSLPTMTAQSDRPPSPPAPRTWDGRLARRLVMPLRDTAVTPNHLTTLRLAIGVAGALCLAHGGYGPSNVGAFLVVLSNFVDHTDGELARISGRTSRVGHLYDLACDAIVTVLLFACLGVGIERGGLPVSPSVLGVVAGVSVATIFFLRMRIESLAGKSGTAQSFAVGFETEDVLYLLPLVTLFDVALPFLVAAAVGAPLFALWCGHDYRRVVATARGPA